MCSELALTVRKRDETLQLWFRDAKLQQSKRTLQTSSQTGLTIAATHSAQLQRNGPATARLEEWLCGVLAACPALKLFYNGRQLEGPRSFVA